MPSATAPRAASNTTGSSGCSARSLRRTRRDVLLIAGGVGITPMRALFASIPLDPGQDLLPVYPAHRAGTAVPPRTQRDRRAARRPDRLRPRPGPRAAVRGGAAAQRPRSRRPGRLHVRAPGLMTAVREAVHEAGLSAADKGSACYLSRSPDRRPRRVATSPPNASCQTSRRANDGRDGRAAARRPIVGHGADSRWGATPTTPRRDPAGSQVAPGAKQHRQAMSDGPLHRADSRRRTSSSAPVLPDSRTESDSAEAPVRTCCALGLVCPLLLVAVA